MTNVYALTETTDDILNADWEDNREHADTFIVPYGGVAVGDRVILYVAYMDVEEDEIILGTLSFETPSDVMSPVPEWVQERWEELKGRE